MKNIKFSPKKKKRYKKSTCKYCGSFSYGKPYCNSCLRTYFNYDSKFKWSYPTRSIFQNKKPFYSETISERAERVYQSMYGVNNKKTKKGTFENDSLNEKIKLNSKVKKILKTDPNLLKTQ